MGGKGAIVVDLSDAKLEAARKTSAPDAAAQIVKYAGRAAGTTYRPPRDG